MRKCVPLHVCVSFAGRGRLSVSICSGEDPIPARTLQRGVCLNVCVFECEKPACAHAGIHLSAHRTKSNTRTLAKLYRIALPSSVCLNDEKGKKKRRKMLRLPIRLLLNQTWMSLWKHFAIRDDWESLNGDILSGRVRAHTDVLRHV